MEKKNLLVLNLQTFAEEEDTGVNEVEETATLQEEDTEDAESETAEENGGGEPHVQTPEENAQFAAMRRRAEAEAQKKVDAELQRINILNQEIAALCGEATNPTTNQPVTNIYEYVEALKEQKRIEREQELQSKGVDPDLVRQMVKNDPDVLQAKRVMAQLQEQQQLAQVQRDVEEIAKLDPNVKNAEDLYNAPYCEALIRYCNQHPGTTLTEAFKVYHYDNHLESRDNAARQQAINQMKGKSHLASQPNSVATENDDIEVPAEIMASQKADGKTEKEIRESYRKIAKKLGLS